MSRHMGSLKSDNTMTVLLLSAKARQLELTSICVYRPITPDLPRMAPGRVASPPSFSFVFS